MQCHFLGIQGPDLLGCGGCEFTQFGCCPDDATPARGPEFAGCGCQGFLFIATKSINTAIVKDIMV